MMAEDKRESDCHTLDAPSLCSPEAAVWQGHIRVLGLPCLNTGGLLASGKDGPLPEVHALLDSIIITDFPGGVAVSVESSEPN